MSQAELAARIGTKQPAIARLEAGHSDLRLSTAVKLAEALDAVVRIHLEPSEIAIDEGRLAPWWIRTHAISLTEHHGSVAADVRSFGNVTAQNEARLLCLIAGKVQYATPVTEPANPLGRLPLKVAGSETAK